MPWEGSRKIAVSGTAGLVAGWCALAICGYRYGTCDQAQYLVQAIASRHPEALVGDPYLDAFGALHSGFWVTLATVVPEAGWPLVCLVLSLVVTATSSILLWAIARACLADLSPRVATIGAVAAPLCFIVPKELNWFGMVSLGDVELTATLAVLPLVFGAILAWVRGSWTWAMVLAAAALPVHGQTAAYLLVALWAAGLVTWSVRSGRERGLLAATFVAGAVAVAVEHRLVGLPRADWTDLERVGHGLYAELVDPLTAPWNAWGAVAAIVLLGMVSVAAALVRRLDTTSAHRRLAVLLVVAGLFPAVGIGIRFLGLDGPLLWRLMVGRSLMIPQIAGLLLAATWSARAIARGGSGGTVAAVALGVIVIWPLPALAHGVAVALTLALLFVMALAPPARPAADPRPALVRLGSSVVVAGLGILILAGVAFGRRAHPWLDRAAPAEWREVQAWARHSTAPGTRFVTPPYLSGWRIESHRPTAGELKDGGLLFFAGRPALAWRDRMAALGIEPPYRWLDANEAAPDPGVLPRRRAGYRAALAVEAGALRAAFDAAYVVTEREFDVEIGVVRFANDLFVVRELVPGPRRAALAAVSAPALP